MNHKEDILNAAIAEFGRNGYKAASTNEIVRQAGVSKGLLFHHFKNKETLYTACQLFVLEEYAKFMTTQADFTSKDFFERILSNLRIKMEFGRKNENYLALINRAWHTEGEGNPIKQQEAVEQIINKYGQNGQNGQYGQGQFLNEIDLSLFRDGMEPARVMDICRLTLEAGWLRFSQRHKHNMQAILADINTYFEECDYVVALLKRGAYK